MFGKLFGGSAPSDERSLRKAGAAMGFDVAGAFDPTLVGRLTAQLSLRCAADAGIDLLGPAAFLTPTLFAMLMAGYLARRNKLDERQATEGAFLSMVYFGADRAGGDVEKAEALRIGVEKVYALAIADKHPATVALLGHLRTWLESGGTRGVAEIVRSLKASAATVDAVLPSPPETPSASAPGGLRFDKNGRLLGGSGRAPD